MSQTIDFTDERGLKRRVLLPDTGGDPNEGIPVSLDVGTLYRHMPPEFIVRLTDALWAQGLIEPRDFLAAGAPERIRAALLATVKSDTMDIITLAKERLGHGQ